MLTRQKLEEKLDKSNKICIVTTCVLPGGAVETIVNYQNLHEKKIIFWMLIMIT